MEYLAALLSHVTRDPGTFQLIFSLVVAIAFFVFVLGIMYLVSSIFDPLRRRIRFAMGEETAPTTRSDLFASYFRPIEPYIIPRNDWKRSKINEKLVHAGFRSSGALTTFYAIKTVMIVLLPGAVVLLASLLPGLTVQQVVLATAIAAFLAVLGPNAVLDTLIRKRIQRIRNGFPDALDLLVVCSEAGLGLNAAIDRVGKELSATYPDLAEELELVNAEVRVGVDRTEALRNLSHRTGLEDIRGLVGLLTQSLRLGTGISDTLRVYSEEFRDKRMQTAEELAAKVGTKMIFPLVTCLFPAFFVVVVGPPIVTVFTRF
jgi:tight adherence protein C